MKQQNLIKVNYNEAIQYYQQQKQLFLSYYKQLANEEDVNAEKKFVAKMAEELNSETVDDEYNKALSLLKNLGNAFTDKSQLKTLREKANKLSLQSKMTGEQILNEITNELVSTEEFYNLVKESINSYGEGFCSKDILIRARSYVRALIQQRIINRRSHNPKIMDRASKMKGYYREGLAYKALSKILYTLGENPPVEIKSMGAENTSVDTLIRFNPQYFQTVVSENIGENLSFGMQEKSWKDPWAKEGYFQSISNKAAVIYSVGSRQDLLNNLENKNSWIAGVNYLGQTNQIKSAIGPNNILYLTGSQFYFTADLITQMRLNSFYLAFVFSPSEYKATSEITWQQRMAHVKWIISAKNKS